MSGTLYIVATPIGNLDDVTARAVKTVQEVDAIICEDTRVTSKLLTHLGISKPLFALHQHSTVRRINEIVERMRTGESLAYVSDAGTPGVNDPGGILVECAFNEGIRVVPIPGPSALTAAISVCGFPMESFTYVGFAPHKKGRETYFREIHERENATVFFESTHRIDKALESLAKFLDPSRLVLVGRELTKMHETLYRGTIDEVRETLHHTSLKGEFVIIIAPRKFR